MSNDKETVTLTPADAGVAAAAKRRHKATFCHDKRTGGYNIWVSGPDANLFEGRTVPVTRKDDTEEMVTLDELKWAGTNPNGGGNAAVYSFTAKPRDDKELEF